LDGSLIEFLVASWNKLFPDVGQWKSITSLVHAACELMDGICGITKGYVVWFVGVVTHQKLSRVLATDVGGVENLDNDLDCSKETRHGAKSLDCRRIIINNNMRKNEKHEKE
jgi:hypothetical protein